MNSLQNYFPIILLIAIAISIFSYVGILFLKGDLRNYKKKKIEDVSINRSFFLLIIFLLYASVNLFLLLPWALSFSKLNVLGFWSILLFLSFFLTAFLYAWKKGLFE